MICIYLKIDPARNYVQRRRLSYDARNRRERRVETVEKGSNKTFYDELILWNEVYFLGYWYVQCISFQIFIFQKIDAYILEYKYMFTSKKFLH